MKIVNRVIIFLTDIKEQEQALRRSKKSEENFFKKFLLNNFQHMGILSVEIDEDSSLIENFIKDVLLEIPGLETCKVFIGILEEIFKDLEIDMNLLKKFKNEEISVNFKKGFFDIFRKGSGLINQNFSNSEKPISRRKTSYDRSEASLDRFHNSEEKNNLTIDFFFKPIDKKLSFNDFFEKKKDKQKDIDNKENLTPNFNSNNFNSSIINKIRDNSNSIHTNTINNNKSNSIRDYENFKTINSAKSFYSEDLESCMNSNSKKTLIHENCTQNSNNFYTENSKLSHESNLRKININYSMSTPCYRNNSGINKPYVSSGKSTNFSQKSFAVSQFSINPRLPSRKSVINKFTTPNESSNHISDFSNNNSQTNISFFNSSRSKLNSGSGINSLLAANIKCLAKTRKGSETNIKSHRYSSSSKKKNKNHVIFVQKFFEKFGRNSANKSIEKNRVKRTPNEKKLKNAVMTNFYGRQNYLIKSPDAIERKISGKKLQNTLDTRESTDKEKGKLFILNEENKNLINSNITNLDNNKMLNNKRQPDKTDIERRMTRAYVKREELQNKRGILKSSEKSITDDEVLAYQTPIKNNGIISLDNLKESPSITTRKNLINLFQQIGKSG